MVISLAVLVSAIISQAAAAAADDDGENNPVVDRVLTSPLFDVGRLWLRAMVQQAQRVLDFLLELVTIGIIILTVELFRQQRSLT